MSTPNQLLEKANRSLEAGRDKVRDAADENRPMTSDEKKTVRSAISDFDNYREQADEARQAQAEANEHRPLEIRQFANTRSRPEGFEKLQRWGQGAGAKEIMLDTTDLAARRKIEVRANRDFERRALTTETSGGGAGNTIFDQFAQEIYDYRESVSGFRETQPRIITTARGGSYHVARVAAHGAAEQVAEAAEIGGTDLTFGQTVMGDFKYAQVIDVSNESLTDSNVDLISLLAEEFGRNLARITDNLYINGNGTTAPQGIAATGGLATGTTGATGNDGEPTLAELKELKYSVEEDYLKDACWLMRYATLGKIAALQDENGQFLWQPANASTEPDRLLGYPVKTSPHIPETATGAKSVFFGAFREACIIRDVAGIEVARSSDVEFRTDQTSFRAILRTDHKVINANAAKAFAGGAT